MSDLRDFNGSSDLNANGRSDGFSFDNIPDNDDRLMARNEDSLGDYHVIDTEAESNTGKIVGALAVALLLGTAGVFAYQSSQAPASNPAAAPQQTAAVAPPPAPAPQQTADTSASVPSTNAPDNAVQPAPVSTPAPVKSRPAIKAARADTSGSDVSSQTAVTPAPAPSEQAAVQPAAPAASVPGFARNDVPAPDLNAPADQPAPAAPAAPDVQQPAAAPAAQSDQPAQPSL